MILTTEFTVIVVVVAVRLECERAPFQVQYDQTGQ